MPSDFWSINEYGMGSNSFITGNPHNMLPMPAAGINPMTEFIQATHLSTYFYFSPLFYHPDSFCEKK